jgi:hypothetical protein
MPQRIEHNVTTGVTTTLELTAEEVVDLEALQATAPTKMWLELRQERNRRLEVSDISVLPDRWDVMDDDTKTIWSTYRQALRDLPANTADPTDPTWPTEPS